MAALAATTGGPSLLLARDRGPSADALEQRGASVVEAFDNQGSHRTGTLVDNISAEWLVKPGAWSGRIYCAPLFDAIEKVFVGGAVQEMDKRYFLQQLINGRPNRSLRAQASTLLVVRTRHHRSSRTSSTNSRAFTGRNSSLAPLTGLGWRYRAREWSVASGSPKT